MEEISEKVERLSESGEYGAALSMCEAELKQNPNNHVAWTLLAKVCMRIGGLVGDCEYAACGWEDEDGERQFANNTGRLLTRGLNRFRSGDFDSAFEFSRQARERGPENAFTNAFAGICFYQREDWNRAVEAFETALDLDGSYSSRRNLVLALRRQAMHDQSVAIAERALAQLVVLSRDFAKSGRALRITGPWEYQFIHEAMGDMHVLVGHREEAIDSYSTAVLTGYRSPCILEKLQNLLAGPDRGGPTVEPIGQV